MDTNLEWTAEDSNSDLDVDWDIEDSVVDLGSDVELTFTMALKETK